MWTEFRITPWRGQEPPFKSGEQFRQWAATHLSNDHKLAFWRNEQGNPLPGMPGITFVRARTGLLVRVYSSSDAGRPGYAELVTAAGNLVLAMIPALSQYVGERMHLSHANGEHGVAAREADYPQTYTVHRLVLPRNKKRRAKAEWGRMMDLAKAVQANKPTPVPVVQDDYPQLIEMIRKGIQDVLGAEETALLDKVTRSIRIVGQPKWASPIKAGTELCFTIRDLQFELPCRFEGRFQIGGLRARGMGDVRLMLQPTEPASEQKESTLES